MMQKPLFAGLLLLLLGQCNASAQDHAACQAGCESDQRQCRTEADARELSERYPPLPDDNEMLDRKRDLRSVLDDRQRASATLKDRKFERYQACYRSYMQCLSVCPGAATPDRPAAAPENQPRQGPQNSVK